MGNDNYINKVTQGNNQDVLKLLDSGSVRCCVTHPPIPHTPHAGEREPHGQGAGLAGEGAGLGRQGRGWGRAAAGVICLMGEKALIGEVVPAARYYPLVKPIPSKQ